MTATTRKILLKKLKLAVENQKQKTRRETIAVTKFSSDEEVETAEKESKKRGNTPNRRITIAPGEKITKPATSSTNGDSSLLPPPSTNRSTRRSSSGRSTPAEKQASTVSSTAPAVPVIQEDTDEEVKETLRTAPKRFSKSKSKTPTLTKSDTVRTSFKSTSEKIVESEEESGDIIVVDDVDVPPPTIYQPKAPVPKEPAAKKTVEEVSRRKTMSSTFTSSIPTPKAYSSRFSSAHVDRPSLTTSFNTYAYSTTTNTPSSVAANLGSSRYKTTYDNFDQEEEDDEDDIAGSAPYLSSFAKRLSTLRAEPLDSGMEKYRKMKEAESTASSTSTSYRPSITYSYKRNTLPAAKQQQSPLFGSIAQAFDNLDRQFNIRKMLYFMFVIFIFVVIYVIFFSH